VGRVCGRVHGDDILVTCHRNGRGRRPRTVALLFKRRVPGIVRCARFGRLDVNIVKREDLQSTTASQEEEGGVGAVVVKFMNFHLAWSRRKCVFKPALVGHNCAEILCHRTTAKQEAAVNHRFFDWICGPTQ